MPKPLVIDLFAGVGGWTVGFLAEGWDCIGFDIERHVYGEKRYPAQLVLQDVLTLDGRQFSGADAIVASPPCQAYSYMAMPWDRAKRESRWQRWMRESPFSPGFILNDLFDACFRIQREASEAAGRHIPMCVENVKGAQPWVGPARAHFGSYYLWGDVESVGGAIVAARPQFGEMLRASRRPKQPGRNFHFLEKFGIASPSFNRLDHEPNVKAALAMKNTGGSWFGVAHNTESGVGQNPVNGIKQAGLSGPAWFDGGMANKSSRSDSRKAASAMIAEIPFPLARYIARCFHPQRGASKMDAWPISNALNPVSDSNFEASI